MIRRALGHAHQALTSDRPLEAAGIYVRLADEAYARGRVRAGVKMDLEATHAFLAARDVSKAEARALNALEQLMADGRLPAQIRPAVERVQAAMAALGAEAEAQAFRERVDALLADRGHTWDDIPDRGQGAAVRSRGRLPAQCPTCYAQLRTDEVDWVEADRAQCTYCGSVVLTE